MLKKRKRWCLILGDNSGGTFIHGVEIKKVCEYKYLGSVFDYKLTWEKNCEIICKKAQQRLYCLRRLHSFSVEKRILKLFYKSFIESVLSFSFICWYRNLSLKNKNSLERIVSLCSKLIGERQRSLGIFNDHQTMSKACQIVQNNKHVLHNQFEIMQSGKRYRCLICRTNRYRFSFVPSAIRALNVNNS